MPSLVPLPFKPSLRSISNKLLLPVKAFDPGFKLLESFTLIGKGKLFMTACNCYFSLSTSINPDELCEHFDSFVGQ